MKSAKKLFVNNYCPVAIQLGKDQRFDAWSICTAHNLIFYVSCLNFVHDASCYDFYVYDVRFFTVDVTHISR